MWFCFCFCLGVCEWPPLGLTLSCGCVRWDPPPVIALTRFPWRWRLLLQYCQRGQRLFDIVGGGGGGRGRKQAKRRPGQGLRRTRREYGCCCPIGAEPALLLFPSCCVCLTGLFLQSRLNLLPLVFPFWRRQVCTRLPGRWQTRGRLGRCRTTAASSSRTCPSTKRISS